MAEVEGGAHPALALAFVARTMRALARAARAIVTRTASGSRARSRAPSRSSARNSPASTANPA